MDRMLVDRIVEILNANLEGRGITAQQADEDLTALGLDSIAFIRVVIGLEDGLGIEIPDEHLLLSEMNTISKIASVVSAVMD